VNPLTGRGPAWANSLFEDNAQFGLGISMGLKQRRASYAAAVKSLLADKEGPGCQELRSAFEEWLQVRARHLRLYDPREDGGFCWFEAAVRPASSAASGIGK